MSEVCKHCNGPMPPAGSAAECPNHPELPLSGLCGSKCLLCEMRQKYYGPGVKCRIHVAEHSIPTVPEVALTDAAQAWADSQQLADEQRYRAARNLVKQNKLIPEVTGEGTLPPLDVTDEDRARAKADNLKTNYTGRRLALMYYCRERQLLALTAQLAAEQEKAEEPQAIFDLGHTRTRKADLLWRAAHPGNDLVLPDLGVLVNWLMQRAEAAEALVTQMQPALELFAKWYEEDSTEFNRDTAFYMAKDALSHANAAKHT